ncbi:unnamed protein product, partial [Mesorhabditis belari]|uniref:Uncharacterized protein n=1 Tax=Mesorhabditis belari TaxID=2138241 RepID=A0AAF3FLF1_9BILA
MFDFKRFSPRKTIYSEEFLRYLFLFLISLIIFIFLWSNTWKTELLITLPNISICATNFPRYRKPSYLSHFDCQRLFAGDIDYIEELEHYGKIKAKELPVEPNCSKLRARVIGDHPAPDLNYSIAFARNVYTDYELLETILGVTYSPTNHYCFHVDIKSTQRFKTQMSYLEKCLPNVHLAPNYLNTTSSGHNNNRAHLLCLELLLKYQNWEYVLMLQNHDLVAHTNSELSKMLSLLNGTNDFNLDNMIWGRVRANQSFTMDDLNFFTKHTPLSFPERETAKLDFAKGLEQATLNRAAVDWMINRVNISTLLDRFDDRKLYAVDEQFFATLQNSETLRMPGGYHSSCLRNRGNKFFTYLTRHTRWTFDRSCKHNRHWICLYGIEDLWEAREIARKHFTLNKFVASHDFGAIICMAESLFNRTHYGDEPFDLLHIRNHSGVRYQKATRQPGFYISNFTCNGI